MNTSQIPHKLILIGDAGVGKTSIVNGFQGIPCSCYEPTAGTLFSVFKDSNTNILFHIYDTAGTEKYRSLTTHFMKGSSMAILVFDVSEKTTFESLDGWINFYREKAGQDRPILVVGNKIDLERKVSNKDAKEWCSQRDLEYEESSARTGKNIKEVMNKAFLIASKSPPQEIITTEYSENKCC
ncbi:Ras family protein [Histomonas meleagridis]|uniref:Ras family protein n=1 Tax=Histomonas meleagridis TaxID=135588 RepID=UPI00355AC6D1|nr:Ras family protein [Histomonas meleagridis]KAH0799512.1 Ras family protein [Histomonas meleagridis]